MTSEGIGIPDSAMTLNYDKWLTEPHSVEHLGELFDNNYKLNAQINILCCKKHFEEKKMVYLMDFIISSNEINDRALTSHDKIVKAENSFESSI